MTLTERAYLAGLIDGEGCITMSVNNWNGANNGNPDRKGTPSGSTKARLIIGMCDEGVIRWVSGLTGATARTFNRRTIPSHWKELWALEWTGKKAAALLRLIVPFLRVKKRQADLLIEWVTLAEGERHLHGRRGGPAYPDWVIARRDEIIREIRTLNQRGILSEKHETAS